MSAAVRITITLELTPDEASALCRLCDKFAFSDANQYLYGHIAWSIREEQSYHMVHAATRVHKALLDAGVTSWPWVETGEAQT